MSQRKRAKKDKEQFARPIKGKAKKKVV